MWGSIVDASDEINWAEKFSQARAIAGLKHDTLAEMMGVKSPQLSQQLGRRGHVSLFRLARVAAHKDPAGKVFVDALFRIIGQELGFGECDPVAASLGNALTALGSVMQHMQLKMARAEFRDGRERRRA